MQKFDVTPQTFKSLFILRLPVTVSFPLHLPRVQTTLNFPGDRDNLKSIVDIKFSEGDAGFTEFNNELLNLKMKPHFGLSAGCFTQAKLSLRSNHFIVVHCNEQMA
jgi:hypothetical protein